MINWTAVLITAIICITILVLFAMSKADDKEDKVEMDKDVVELLEEKKHE